MLRRVTLLAVVAALLGLAACYPVPSIHPFYTEREVVFDENLLGLWATADDKHVLQFEQASDLTYRVSFTSEGKWSKYEARLVRLGTNTYLDALPDEAAYEGVFQSQAFLPLVRTHTVYHIELERNVLRVAFLDGEWAKKQRDDGELALPHAELDDLLVLTAPTAQLQDLVVTHESTAGAFTLFGEFRRQAPR